MCPSLGQPCSTNLLCGRGLYCKANAVGEGGKSFTGVCSTGPDITEVRRQRGNGLLGLMDAITTSGDCDCQCSDSAGDTVRMLSH